MWVLRFLMLAIVKVIARLLYSFKSESITPEIPWADIRLAALLNHTSLFEPLFAAVLPWTILLRMAKHGTLPIAAETLRRPLAGMLYRLMVAHVIPLTRKRDDSWDLFMTQLDPQALILIMPEGRMKRPGGLDKHGNPMTVRGGIVDLLNTLKTGGLLIGYSGGLHQVQIPGQLFPKPFKQLAIHFEYLRIERYLQEFKDLDDRSRRKAIVANLEKRRDRYCDN